MNKTLPPCDHDECGLTRCEREAKPPFDEARLLECGHPGLPNNLIDGKCGTCLRANEWEELAKETKDKALKEATLKIANCFRSGMIVYDKNGKSLLEIEAASRPHSNAQGEPHGTKTK